MDTQDKDKQFSTTIPLEARIDVRAIATLALYFMEKGVNLRSRSSVLRTAVEDSAREKVKNGATPIRGVAEAYTFMQKHGYMQKSRKMNRDFFATILDDTSDDDMIEMAQKIQENINTKTTDKLTEE